MDSQSTSSETKLDRKKGRNQTSDLCSAGEVAGPDILMFECVLKETFSTLDMRSSMPGRQSVAVTEEKRKFFMQISIYKAGC